MAEASAVVAIPSSVAACGGSLTFPWRHSGAEITILQSPIFSEAEERLLLMLPSITSTPVASR